MKKNKVPPFILCIDNAGHKLCEPGRIYCTAQPVNRYHSNNFWSDALRLFPEEFKPSTAKDYNQQQRPDKSFDSIDATLLKAEFHSPVPEKKKPKSNPPLQHTGIKIPRYLKYVKQNLYIQVWLAISKQDIGKVFRTDIACGALSAEQALVKWRVTYTLHRDCYEISTKLQWNMSREHSENIKTWKALNNQNNIKCIIQTKNPNTEYFSKS